MSDNYSTDPIRQMQDDIENDIRADVWFTGISIIRSEPGDVLAKITEKLGKLGLCIVIQPLEGSVEGGSELEMDVGITVNENPTLNRTSSGTRKTATQAVIQLCRVFSGLDAKSTILNRWILVNDSDGLLVYLLKGSMAAHLTLT